MISEGSVSVTNNDLRLATANRDFISTMQPGFVDLDNGVTSAIIQIQILPDEEPEVDEVFVVRLLSVTLMDLNKATPEPLLGKFWQR